MLKVNDLSKSYRVQGGRAKAQSQEVLKKISFELKKGEVIGIIGENGSGKSTLAKILMALSKPSTGKVFFEGRDIFKMKKRELMDYRKDVQIVWQNPDTALNPMMTVESALLEPLRIHRIKDGDHHFKRISEALQLVGLVGEHRIKYPHQLSGGERQRVAIARSLILEPKLLILDEPLSQLDAALRLRLLETLLKIKEKRGISYLYISHDLASLGYLSDKVLIFNGGIVERELSIEDILSQDTSFFEEMITLRS